MLELDFNKIQFCGRQEELLKLQLAFDQARRNTDSKSSSSSSQPQRRGGQRQQQAPSLKQIQEQEDGIFNQALRESDEEDQQKSEVEQKVVDDEGGPDDPVQPKLPIVLISGASGTGKTALVEHFLQQQKDKIQRQLQKKCNSSRNTNLVVPSWLDVANSKKKVNDNRILPLWIVSMDYWMNLINNHLK